MRNKVRRAFFRIVSIVASLIVVAVTAGCVPGSIGIGRLHGLGYRLVIAPPENGELNDFVLYAPFPRDDDELQEDLVEDIKNDYERQIKVEGKTNLPEVTLSSVDTKNGKMLKVEIPQLWKEVVLIGDYEYGTLLPRGRPDRKYPFRPLYGDSKTALFSENAEESDFYLWLSYGATYQDHYIYQQIPQGVGTVWFVAQGPRNAKDADARQSYLEGRLKIQKMGWTEAPVWIER